MVISMSPEIGQELENLNDSSVKFTEEFGAGSSFQLTPCIGTEFGEDVQLCDIVRSENKVKQLARLVSERGVVFFRNQDLSADEQVQLGDLLGRVTGRPKDSGMHVHPLTQDFSETGEKILTISSELNMDNYSGQFKSTWAYHGWHSDISFEPVPSDYAILKMTTLPKVGGDTLWASSTAAYNKLSKSMQDWLCTLEAVHECLTFKEAADKYGFTLRGSKPGTCRGNPANTGESLRATHPVIRTNPVSGQNGIYVNRNFTKRIVGLSKDESDTILNMLFNLVELNHDLTCRFRWTTDAVAIWDNRSTLHTATNDYGLEERFGSRVISCGEKPFCQPSTRASQ